VAFVVSTYGDGEPTDNAKDFMNWLLDDAREPNMLNRLKYIIFGLGNKTYEHYNAVRHRPRCLVLVAMRPELLSTHWQVCMRAIDRAQA